GWSGRGRMDVVEGAAFCAEVVRDRRWRYELDVIPADVWDGQAGGVQSGHLPGDQSETACWLYLLGALEQQLHSEADAEDGCGRLGALRDQRRKPQIVECRHRFGKSAHAGYDHAVSGFELGVVACDHDARADVLE